MRKLSVSKLEFFSFLKLKFLYIDITTSACYNRKRFSTESFPKLF